MKRSLKDPNDNKIWEYYEQLYANALENEYHISRSLGKLLSLKLAQE